MGLWPNCLKRRTSWYQRRAPQTAGRSNANVAFACLSCKIQFTINCISITMEFLHPLFSHFESLLPYAVRVCPLGVYFDLTSSRRRHLVSSARFATCSISQRRRSCANCPNGRQDDRNSSRNGLCGEGEPSTTGVKANNFGLDSLQPSRPNPEAERGSWP